MPDAAFGSGRQPWVVGTELRNEAAVSKHSSQPASRRASRFEYDHCDRYVPVHPGEHRTGVEGALTLMPE